MCRVRRKETGKESEAKEVVLRSNPAIQTRMKCDLVKTFGYVVSKGLFLTLNLYSFNGPAYIFIHTHTRPESNNVNQIKRASFSQTRLHESANPTVTFN